MSAIGVGSPTRWLPAEGKPADEYIFTRKDGRPLADRDLQQHVFRPAAEAVGIYFEGFGLHVFRSLNVTGRQQAGATPIEAQKAAGHGSLDMTLLYTATERDRERDKLKRSSIGSSRLKLPAPPKI